VSGSAKGKPHHRVRETGGAVATLRVLERADAADESRRIAGVLSFRLLTGDLALLLPLLRRDRIDQTE
jgi:hypothetical protein